ncbi:isoprenyl transferase [Propylenella binzhouense]|uniref:Isoprenyl transferase n=1 Tax=Propylenella binzhouense TaxID=2555902 RepID=A0A964T3D4_9HYPH|nr:isoprenyl transferase [Propylenella binzhouense]MYZ47731.1 isoprenyl transferase [Propylenella binzhouense]
MASAPAKQIEPAVLPERIPRHVAIIMDGNGRWANARGLPRAEGHRRGVEVVRRAVRYAGERGIRYLTLFSFSSENWSRPQSEIQDLLNLLRLFIRRDLSELKANNVRIHVIGARTGLPGDIRELIEAAERETAANTGLVLQVAFNYGARDEIVRAARRLAEKAARGEVKAEEIGADLFQSCLDTAGTPDPDLVIRTSGEKRISNFLLWQAAYAEFVFMPVLWPDFDDAHFDAALREFAGRERRFGGIRSE